MLEGNKERKKEKRREKGNAQQHREALLVSMLLPPATSYNVKELEKKEGGRKERGFGRG